MKINTYKDFFLDAMKSLKRNKTITITSVISVSGNLFIVGLFILYIISVNKNSSSLFWGNEAMGMVFRLIEVAIFILSPIFSFFLIVNAIKMAIFTRRDEISIMKSVGATNWFIRWPFIIEGAVIGSLGAVIGNLSLFLAYSFVYSKAMEFTRELSIVQPSFIVNTMLLPFVIYGVLIGPIGSIIALRKFLKCTVWES